jgi:hypothetical protein
MSRFASRLCEYIETIKTFRDNQGYSRLSRFCQDFLNFFVQKFKFPTLFAHFEANFDAQNVNKKCWELILIDL